MAAAFEMPIGCLGLRKRECPVDHGRKRCSAMARFIASKSARLPTQIDPSVMPRPVNNRGSSPVPRRRQARTNQADASAYRQGLQRHCDGSRPADLDNTIDAAAVGQLAHLRVPIGRLSVVDHIGSPQRFEPLGFLGGLSRRDHPSAQDPGELKREDRNTPGTLGQDGISRGDPAMAR